MSTRIYIVYDERAMFDVDGATVLESFNARNDKAARCEALNTWREVPFVLYGANLESGVAHQDDNPIYINHAGITTG